ncbi:translin-associated protein X isoform X1 [Diorhabda carinulata]|uniref:translin-associated protein X isoform X1 n=1 Tax=Diorhabda carinulata TaxID=1163345 RepID=UPI0025A034FE|nr:translin-associated protein X isoform X1 [Diorhabda carinulata]
MSRTGGKNRKNKFAVGDKAKETLEKLADDDPIMLMFREYARNLDDKHDRYERIVKLSRDITIESKRIIFLLHSTNADIESKRKKVVEEAEKRIKALVDTTFKSIALELIGLDSYQYHRAYTGGVQEFIEACAFCSYIKNESVEDWNTMNSMFQYKTENGDDIGLLFPHTDYILGLADFTGELMRRCLNTLGVGNVGECFKLCNFVRHINTGFLGLMAPGQKELSRKGYVLRQSLSKMELVCYNIQIRGSEIPKHMLLSVIESSDAQENEDEGFF